MNCAAAYFFMACSTALCASASAANHENRHFTGHYGLSFDYPVRLTVESRMDGATEIIEIFNPSIGTSSGMRDQYAHITITTYPITYADHNNLIEERAREDWRRRTAEKSAPPLAPPFFSAHYHVDKNFSIINIGSLTSSDPTPIKIALGATSRFVDEKDPAWLRITRFPVTLYTLMLLVARAGLQIDGHDGALPDILIVLAIPSFLFLGISPLLFNSPRTQYSRLGSTCVHIVVSAFVGCLGGAFFGFLGWAFSEYGWNEGLTILLTIAVMTAHMWRHAIRDQNASWLDIAWRILAPALLFAAVLLPGSLRSRFDTPQHLPDLIYNSAVPATVICSSLGLAWGALSKRPCRPF